MTSTAVAPAASDVRPTAEIRDLFPALERRHRGHPVAYFDGPGGTQVPRAVAEAVRDYLLHHNANTHWRYPTSEETDRILAEARASLADLLGAGAAEIVFGANMTTLTFHLSRALGRGWGPGDEVVITELDHHANVAPWRALERERGVTIRAVPLALATGELDWSALERAITAHTRLLAIGAASNALGTITEVSRACALARAAGAVSFIDAVHYAPHALVDVRAIGCDFLACSAYKFYGPHVGVLFGQQARLEALDAPKLAPAPDSAPERMETGTLDHEGIAGAGAAVEFLAGLAAGGTRRERLQRVYAGLHQRGQELVERLWEGLRAIPGVVRYGPPPGRPRTPTVSFTVDGRSSEEVAVALAGQGVFVSNGDFYATTVVERLGLAGRGLVRAGCACYTTADEIDRLIAGVASLRRA
jgi:cysteine desulfurase family protein (TIGR01976 family)